MADCNVNKTFMIDSLSMKEMFDNSKLPNEWNPATCFFHSFVIILRKKIYKQSFPVLNLLIPKFKVKLGNLPDSKD